MTATPQQAWNPRCYSENARFVPELGRPLIELLAPRSGERILDLGCGDGALTRELTALGVHVIGVDASPEMIAAARALGLDARVIDGRALPFESEFDAVFSNAALHWMPSPDSVIAGVWRALRPGGRFVAEMGGAGNCATIVAALETVLSRRGIDPRPLNPWYFPSVEEYSQRLTAAGFTVGSIALIPRPTPLPGDMVGWLETFGHSFAAALPLAERAAFFSEVAALCRPAFRDAEGRWTADYVRLRFTAAKPA